MQPVQNNSWSISIAGNYLQFGNPPQDEIAVPQDNVVIPLDSEQAVPNHPEAWNDHNIIYDWNPEQFPEAGDIVMPFDANPKRIYNTLMGKDADFKAIGNSADHEKLADKLDKALGEGHLIIIQPFENSKKNFDFYFFPDPEIVFPPKDPEEYVEFLQKYQFTRMPVITHTQVAVRVEFAHIPH